MGENYSSGTTPLAVNPTRVIEVKILNALNGGAGGGGGSGGLVQGHYSGGQPNFTPSSGVGIAFDQDTGRVWNYFNGVWQ